MSLPALATADRDAYLARLGVRAPSKPDRAALDVLIEAHLRAVPFHNLFVLEGGGRDPGLPPVELAIERALQGLGGACHQLSPPFATLLRAVGYEVHLAAGDCGQPGDHLLVVVHLGGVAHVVDVANGQPYVTAFPVDDCHHEVRRYGWHVRFGPLRDQVGGRTHGLSRRQPDGSWKAIWTVSVAPRAYADFGPIIRDHHMRPGFGPFLTGLRVVRMTHTALLTLRDTLYERHSEHGHAARQVCDREAVKRLLGGPFGLPELPFDAALAALARAAPSRWAAWGEPARDPVAEAEREVERSSWSRESVRCLIQSVRAHPLSREDPRVILATVLTDRPEAWRRLASSVRAQMRRFRIPAPRWGFVVLDNSRDPTCREGNRDLATRLRGEGVHTHYVLSPTARMPISESRLALNGLLLRWARGEIDGLPHSADGEGPVVVWVIDDDRELATLVLRDGSPARVPAFSYAHRIARVFREHPEIGVALGGDVGAPPIPAHATLQGQLLDLVVNVREMAALRPQARWSPPPNPRHLRDYYYDHAEGAEEHLHVPFLWEAGRGASVREALLGLLRAFPDVLAGEQVTRPLLYAGWEPPSASTARGGNTVFLDVDALFAIPQPVARLEGIPLRRSDTAWAALAAREPGLAVARVALPALHCRRHARAATEVESGEPGALVDGILAQTWGTVLARLVAQEAPPCSARATALVEERLTRIERGFALARERAAGFLAEAWGSRGDAWWGDDAEVLQALGRVEGVLTDLIGRLPVGRALPRRDVGPLAQVACALRGATP